MPKRHQEAPDEGSQALSDKPPFGTGWRRPRREFSPGSLERIRSVTSLIGQRDAHSINKPTSKSVPDIETCGTREYSQPKPQAEHTVSTRHRLCAVIG
jgi:hypothetical protein